MKYIYEFNLYYLIIYYICVFRYIYPLTIVLYFIIYITDCVAQLTKASYTQAVGHGFKLNH